MRDRDGCGGPGDDVRRGLSPEEDAMGDPEDADDGIDDLLPGDLWF